DEDLARLVERVEVGIVPLALVGQPLHRRVLQVTRADTQHGEEDAALALLFDQTDQLILAGHADVEVAVGGQDHAVHAAADELLAGKAVGQRDAGPAVGAAAPITATDRVT